MADITSARVADLERFARRTEQAIRTLDADGRRLLMEYFEFQGRSDYPVVRDELIASFGAALRNWGDLALFTDLVAAALQAADNGANGIHTVVDSVVTQQMAVEMSRRGLPPDALHTESVVVPSYALPPIPRTSGFVNDPVATATGYFVFDVHDLGRRAAQEGVTWRRVYGSGPSPAGSLGPGWSTWADCRLDADGDVLRYTGPDGLHAELVPDGHGGSLAPPWFEGAVTGDGAGGHLLAWHRWSPEAGAVWRFDDRGLLREARSARTMRTSFEHDGAGRLTAVVGSNGARATLTWSGDRVAEVTGTDLTVRYSYADGLLVGVSSARGNVRYDHDARGRIVREIDADGVVHFVNDYDDDGRAVHQDVPGDGATTFEHTGPGTLVVRGGGGTTSIWRHDALRRLTNVSVPGAFRLERRYDAEGRIRAQRWNGSLTEVRRADDGSSTEVSVDGEVRERFEHDAAGRLVRHSAPDVPDVVVDYGDGTDLPCSIDLGGGAFELGWDGTTLVRLVDPDGVVMAVSRHGDGEVAGVSVGETETGADVLGLERDGAGRIGAVAPRGGARHELAYTDAGRLRSVTGTDGTRTEIEWDDAGRPVAIIDQDGGTSRFEWASATRLRAVQSEEGPAWRYEHDVLGRVTGMVADGSTTWSFTYGDGALPTSVTAPDGAVLRILRDAGGLPAEVTTPLGHRWRVERDGAGRPVRLELPTGDARTYAWDGGGRPAEVVDADGQATVFTWSPAGRLLRVERDGLATERTYDDAGRVVAERRQGREQRYEWSDRGLLRRAVTDGVETRFEHDDAGRVVAVRRGDAEWRVSYDEVGRPAEVVPPGEGPIRYEHGPGSRLDAVTDALGGRTAFAHDRAGRVTGTTSPLGSTTRATFDGFGRLATATDALSRVTSFGYDPAGRLAWRLEPDGTRTEWARDADGDVVGVHVDGVEVERYERDALGRTARVIDSAAVTEITWSPEGRLLSIARDGARTEWTADRPGAVSGTLRLSDGRELRVETDERAEVRSVSAGAAAFAVERDEHGRVTAIRAGAHGRLTERGAAGLPSAVTWATPDGGTSTRRFERDDAGRIMAIEADGAASRYGYDAAGQLVAVDGQGGEHRFAYDPDGCLVDETGPTGRRSFTYDAAHQLVGAGDVRINHDGTGRRVREVGPAGERAFEWDELGRLRKVTSPDGVTTFDHDPFGRLCAVDGTTVEWDAFGAVPLPVRVGHWALVAVDGAIVAAVADDGEMRLAAPAPAGTDPWHLQETISLDGGIAVGRFGEIAVAGLVLCGERVYDPATRAFLSRDALPAPAGHPAAANPYAFAANDPVNRTDPDGREAVTIEQLEAYRKDVTGPQWGNIIGDIVMVGAVVAGVALTATGVGSPLGVALVVGATSGGAGALGKYAGDSVDNGTDFDIGTALLTTTVGTVAGGAGAGLGYGAGRVLTNQVTSRFGAGVTGNVLRREVTTKVVEGATGGFTEGVIVEGTNAMAGRGFDAGALAERTLLGAGTGAAGHYLQGPADKLLGGGGLTSTLVDPPSRLLLPAHVSRPVIEVPRFVVVDARVWTPPPPGGFVQHGSFLVPEGSVGR